MRSVAPQCGIAPVSPSIVTLLAPPGCGFAGDGLELTAGYVKAGPFGAKPSEGFSSAPKPRMLPALPDPLDLDLRIVYHGAVKLLPAAIRRHGYRP